MTQKGSLAICLVVASAGCVGAWPAAAQTAAGEITGLVKDQAGAAVPGATITVTLGSPNNTASDFSTSVTQIADSLTWLKAATP